MKFCLNDFLELNTNELLTVNGGYYCNGSSPSTQGYVATCMPSFKTSMGYYYGNNISLGGNCGIVNISFFQFFMNMINPPMYVKTYTI
mgnify:CR=1 FL=1